MKFTDKEVGYLNVGGLNSDYWTDEEKRDFIDSMSDGDKKEFDKYAWNMIIEDV